MYLIFFLRNNLKNQLKNKNKQKIIIRGDHFRFDLVFIKEK
jgi:hypothetical protein